MNLSNKIINAGIIFIWSEKEYLGQILRAMEKKKFQYIENVCIVMLSKLKVAKLACSKNNVPASNQYRYNRNDFAKVDVNQVLAEAPFKYLQRSKKVLLMFRKCNDSKALELRHQRTMDSCFTEVSDSYENPFSNYLNFTIYFIYILQYILFEYF